MRRRFLAALPLALGLTSAEAVYLNADGIGQALIYPYYTARSAGGNAFNTFISVVNHNLDAKVVRVRFREGHNGREVAGFNLYLGPNDMWTGAVVPSIDGASLLSNDISCTNPLLWGRTGAPGALVFGNAAFSGANADDGVAGLDRVREGYVEMIEMATLTGAAAQAATVGQNGVATCQGLQGVDAAPTGFAAPSGGLSGTLTVINVASGMDFTVNADALADLLTQPIYRNYPDPYPDFDAAEILPLAHVVNEGKAYRMTFTRPVDAVSAVLAHDTVKNEFVRDFATLSQTDWVVTYPTRRFYVTAAGATGPFSRSISGEACEDSQIYLFNREQRATGALDGGNAGGAAGYSPLRMCHATTVLSTRPPSSAPSSVLGSTNVWRPAYMPSLYFEIFASGWAYLTSEPRTGVVRGVLRSTATSTARDLRTDQVTTGTVTVQGLPSVGFALRTFQNGTLSCNGAPCQGNYGGSFSHKFTRNITIAP